MFCVIVKVVLALKLNVVVVPTLLTINPPSAATLPDDCIIIGEPLCKPCGSTEVT